MTNGIYDFFSFFYSLDLFFPLFAGQIKLHNLSPIDRAIFLSGKALHFSLYFFIPLYVLGVESWFWGWYLPTQLVGGCWLASVFAVSHNNTLCEHNCPSTDWAELQVHNLNDYSSLIILISDYSYSLPLFPQIRTSANWSSDSLMWNLASGGLNCQIEHHLFPGSFSFMEIVEMDPSLFFSQHFFFFFCRNLPCALPRHFQNCAQILQGKKQTNTQTKNK